MNKSDLTVRVTKKHYRIPAEVLNANPFKKGKVRYSVKNTARRVVFPNTNRTKVSMVRQSLAQPRKLVHQSLIMKARGAGYNMNKSDNKKRDPSIETVSYKSIDNKYGLVVRKLERNINFDTNEINQVEPYSQSLFEYNPRVTKVKTTNYKSNLTNEEYGLGSVDINRENSEMKLQSAKHIGKYDFQSKPVLFDQREEIKSATVNLFKKPTNVDKARSVVSFDDDFNVESEFGVYKGDIINGKITGQGQLQLKDGYVVYDGSFLENRFDGHGILFNPLNQEEKEAVSGSFTDLNTIGDNWEKYEGSFKDDKKSGVGTLFISNGDVFFGHFEDDMACGYGIYKKAEGERVMGIWQDNKLNKLL